MTRKSFSKIVSNFLLVAVLIVSTISNVGDRLGQNSIYSRQDSWGASIVAAANKSTTTYPTDDSNLDGLLYGDDSAESLDSVDDLVDRTTQDKVLDPAQIPAVKQPIVNRSNPDNKLLEKVGQMFDDSGVLTDK